MTPAPPPAETQGQDPGLLRAAHAFQQILLDAGAGEIPANLILSKAQQFMRGLPIEDEFEALALWSDRCRIIHRLDQDQMPLSSRRKYQVPDFLAAVEYDGRIVPFLVEVKKRDLRAGFNLNEGLPFSRIYHEKLAAYARLVGLPLLIAWKAEPFSWFLFDFEVVKKVKTAYRISAADAMMNNLLGLLLGDFSFHLRENSSFVMEIERHTKGKKQFTGTIRDVYWRAYDGERVTVDNIFFDLFMFSPDDVEINDSNDFITQRFFKVDTASVFSHRLLQLAAHGYTESPTPWRNIREKGFRYSLTQLRSAAEDAAGNGMIETIIDMAPPDCPDFLLLSSGIAPKSLLRVGRGGLPLSKPT